MEGSQTRHLNPPAYFAAGGPTPTRGPYTTSAVVHQRRQLNHLPQYSQQHASNVFSPRQWTFTGGGPAGPYGSAGASHLAYTGTLGSRPYVWSNKGPGNFDETGSNFPQAAQQQGHLKTRRRSWGRPVPAVSYPHPPAVPHFQQIRPPPPQFYYTYPQPAPPPIQPPPVPYLLPYPQPFQQPPQFLGNNYHGLHRTQVPQLPQQQSYGVHGPIPSAPAIPIHQPNYPQSQATATTATHTPSQPEPTMQSAMGSQYGVGPEKCDVCGVSFTGADAPPASNHGDTWQHRLGQHCKANQLATPVYILGSDRRGGRTAWSSTVYTNGNQETARYWYAGHFNAHEDAAEVLFKRLQNTRTPPTSPGSVPQHSPQEARRMPTAPAVSRPYNSPSSSGSMSPTTNYTYAHAPSTQQQGQRYQLGQPQQQPGAGHNRSGSAGHSSAAPRGSFAQEHVPGYYPKSPQSGSVTQAQY